MYNTHSQQASGPLLSTQKLAGGAYSEVGEYAENPSIGYREIKPRRHNVAIATGTQCNSHKESRRMKTMESLPVLNSDSNPYSMLIRAPEMKLRFSARLGSRGTCSCELQSLEIFSMLKEMYFTS